MKSDNFKENGDGAVFARMFEGLRRFYLCFIGMILWFIQYM